MYSTWYAAEDKLIWDVFRRLSCLASSCNKDSLIRQFAVTPFFLKCYWLPSFCQLPKRKENCYKMLILLGKIVFNITLMYTTSNESEMFH